ncbi:MAG: hypothetical protein H6656_10255 [Ardenticatenaceae bacterium]|nr:hypothetical protein [Ardenticatenaceae bacterium]
MAQRTAPFFGPEPQIALHQIQAEAENMLKAWQWWAVEQPSPDLRHRSAQAHIGTSRAAVLLKVALHETATV